MNRTDFEKYLAGLKVSGQKCQILHALMSLGVNLNDYTKVSIKDQIQIQTSITAKQISQQMTKMKRIKIIDSKYNRSDKTLFVRFLPPNKWLI